MSAPDDSGMRLQTRYHVGDKVRIRIGRDGRPNGSGSVVVDAEICAVSDWRLRVLIGSTSYTAYPHQIDKGGA